MPVTRAYEVVVLGATPGGIAAALAAARRGRQVLLLERSARVGGLLANGLGLADPAGGICREFTRRVLDHYASAYGAASRPAVDCAGGCRFEPHVAEAVFEQMLAEQRRVTVRRRRQFNAAEANVQFYGPRLIALRVQNRDTRRYEVYGGRVFIDATNEGDLAAAAGAPYRIGRESRNEFREPGAGRVYWDGARGEFLEGTTGEGDRAVQAYTYHFCLTNDPALCAPIEPPAGYRREEYAALLDEVKAGRLRQGVGDGGEPACVRALPIPNGKFDTDDQPGALLSTDLPEENAPYPEADWAWRDEFARRLRDYELGLLWFCGHDPELPEAFRAAARPWGLPKDEYADNGHFPGQLDVREGRRIEGEYTFTALDGLAPNGLPCAPHRASVAAVRHPVDSRACRKREAGRPVREGAVRLEAMARPCQAPYGVMVPKKVEGLLTPVPCSASHLGFSALRPESCRMALGQAAGVAADLALAIHSVPRAVDVDRLQRALLQQRAVLLHFTDLPEDHPHFAAVQYFGLRGNLPGQQAEPDKPITREEAERWSAGAAIPCTPGVTTRGQFLQRLYDRTA